MTCDRGFVEWPGEVDLAPDAMYEEIKANGKWVLDLRKPGPKLEPRWWAPSHLATSSYALGSRTRYADQRRPSGWSDQTPLLEGATGDNKDGARDADRDNRSQKPPWRKARLDPKSRPLSIQGRGFRCSPRANILVWNLTAKSYSRNFLVRWHGGAG